VKFGITELVGGYLLEVSIPWSAIGITAVSRHTIGLDVHINDDDDGQQRDGKRSWHSITDDTWHNPRTFGTAHLLGVVPFIPETQFARAVTGTPQIDGDTDADSDPAWAAWTDPALPIAQSIIDDAPVDVDASWRGIWDHENLYLAVTVAESTPPYADDPELWWHDDSVEVFLDPGLRRGTSYDGLNNLQLVFRPNDDSFIFGARSARVGTGVEVASLDTPGGGYTMEIKIPWSTIGGAVGLAGTAVGFDIHVNDDDSNNPSPDRSGKRAWALSPAIGDISYQTPSALGRVGLGP
jgi:hypothetical protein